MKDQEFFMWEYWRDKKGIENALRHYYLRTLSTDYELKGLLESYKSIENEINKKMKQLSHESNEMYGEDE